MFTLQLVRAVVNDSNAHKDEQDTLNTMLKAGHPDSIKQRSIVSSALTRYQVSLYRFRLHWPGREDQMIRIILNSR